MSFALACMAWGFLGGVIAVFVVLLIWVWWNVVQGRKAKRTLGSEDSV